MEEYIEDIKKHNLQNRTISIVENSTWAPGISKKIKENFQEMKNMNILEEVVAIKSSMKQEQFDGIDKLVNEILNDMNK